MRQRLSANANCRCARLLEISGRKSDRNQEFGPSPAPEARPLPDRERLRAGILPVRLRSGLRLVEGNHLRRALNDTKKRASDLETLTKMLN
jgi:hypothetical protein